MRYPQRHRKSPVSVISQRPILSRTHTDERSNNPFILLHCSEYWVRLNLLHYSFLPLTPSLFTESRPSLLNNLNHNGKAWSYRIHWFPLKRPLIQYMMFQQISTRGLSMAAWTVCSQPPHWSARETSTLMVWKQTCISIHCSIPPL